MMTESFKGFGRAKGAMVVLAVVLSTVLVAPAAVSAQQPSTIAQAAPSAVEGQPETVAPATQAQRGGGEANLILPDLDQVTVGGYDSRVLLLIGMVVSVAGIAFGLVILYQLKNLPVHRSMREISELIYETCKTYLITQGKFIFVLWLFIGLVVALYFGRLAHTIDPVTGADVQGLPLLKVVVILLFSVVGILGSYSVAWFGIRVNTYANSRTAFASLEGRPYPVYAIPLKAGMSIGMLLISVGC